MKKGLSDFTSFVQENINYKTDNINEYRTKKVVPNGETTVLDGKPVKIDVDAEKGKPATKKKRFAIDEPKSDDAARWDGQPAPWNVQQIMSKVYANEPFFVIGHAGWGKSSIIKKVAKKYGKTIITVYLDKIPPEDLGGIPVPVKGKDRNEQEILLPVWAQYIYDHPETDFLLFFDEMNQARGEVLNALMPIILENTICDIEMPNYMVGGAGNYRDENNCVNDLPDPIISRVAPIIVWKDDDEESWEDSFDYIKGEWKGQLDGKADFLLGVLDKYKTLFKNPRELEHKIFKWLDNIFKTSKKIGKPVTDNEVNKKICIDRLSTLFVKEKGIENLAAYKREVLNDPKIKGAIDIITDSIMNIVFSNNPSEIKSTSTKVGKMSPAKLKEMKDLAQEGSFLYPFDSDTTNADTIIVARDNMCDLFEDMTKQYQDQMEVAMGDIKGRNGYAWQTEAEAKKKHPDWLTYKEATKKYPDL